MSTLSGHDMAAYSERIQLDVAQAKPTLQVLHDLQFAHIQRIPFENLSLHHPNVVQPSVLATAPRCKALSMGLHVKAASLAGGQKKGRHQSKAG